MKVFVSLILILLGAQISFGQQKEFVENALDYFCRNCSFLVLNVVTEDFTGKVIVQNNELYSYLEKTKGFDKTQYKVYVRDLIINNQSLQLKSEGLTKNELFIKVENAPEHVFNIIKENKEADEIAAKGCQTFVKFYFLGESLETIKNSPSMTCREFINSQKEPLRLGAGKGVVDFTKRNAIIEKLFEWQIAVAIRDITYRVEIVK